MRATVLWRIQRLNIGMLCSAAMVQCCPPVPFTDISYIGPRLLSPLLFARLVSPFCSSHVLCLVEENMAAPSSEVQIVAAKKPTGKYEHGEWSVEHGTRWRVQYTGALHAGTWLPLQRGAATLCGAELYSVSMRCSLHGVNCTCLHCDQLGLHDKKTGLFSPLARVQVEFTWLWERCGVSCWFSAIADQCLPIKTLKWDMN